MSRPNKPRSIASEAALGRRVAVELDRREMKPATLAQRMTDVGCPINTSAIYKIINPPEGKPRRITVDELVALADVFEVPVDDLLLPPELADEQDLRDMFERWVDINREVKRLIDDELDLWGHILWFVRRRSDLLVVAESLITKWAEVEGRSKNNVQRLLRELREGRVGIPVSPVYLDDDTDLEPPADKPTAPF